MLSDLGVNILTLILSLKARVYDDPGEDAPDLAMHNRVRIEREKFKKSRIHIADEISEKVADNQGKRQIPDRKSSEPALHFTVKIVK